MEPNNNLSRKTAFHLKKQGINKTMSNILFQPQQSKKVGRKWTKKYKSSINCKKPKGFSQKQYCKYGRGRKSKKQQIRR